MSRAQITRGDITLLDVDAIVNAANESLLGGGGVDGAIHRRAGPELLEACRKIPEVRAGVRCPTGEARLTPAFRLRARFVIHTVGPVYRGGAWGEAELLASCYQSALAVARAHGLASIAFPAISCGAYGYPAAEATVIAVREVTGVREQEGSGPDVYLVAFDERIERALRGAVAQLSAG